MSEDARYLLFAKDLLDVVEKPRALISREKRELMAEAAAWMAICLASFCAAVLAVSFSALLVVVVWHWAAPS